MAREMINDSDAGKVVGGSIIFNEDCSQCGYNCNDQYQVLDLDAALDYIDAHGRSMSERRMLSNLVSLGYLAPL